MKTFKEIIQEATETTEFSRAEVEKTVKDGYAKYFPNSLCTLYNNNIGSDGYMIFTCYIGKDKSDFSNGIQQNDPLNLSFTIDIDSSPVSIDYKAKSISISPPEDSYLAFGREKLKLRKTKVKNIKDLKSKMEKAFKMVHEVIKTLIKEDKFSVYERDGILDMIKKKVK